MIKFNRQNRLNYVFEGLQNLKQFSCFHLFFQYKIFHKSHFKTQTIDSLLFGMIVLSSLLPLFRTCLEFSTEVIYFPEFDNSPMYRLNTLKEVIIAVIILFLKILHQAHILYCNTRDSCLVAHKCSLAFPQVSAYYLSFGLAALLRITLGEKELLFLEPLLIG